eukprot:Skav201398  [mRNA]  locus=scaffold296:346170:346370:- [translate_table: standard]
MPHIPQTRTAEGPPSQPVPSSGWWSTPQKFSSWSWRKRRMVPCSPNMAPHEFMMVQYFCCNSLSLP